MDIGRNPAGCTDRVQTEANAVCNFGLSGLLSQTLSKYGTTRFFPIPSPCIGVCEANAKGYCKGCLRSREERLYWQKMSDDQKHQVMRLLGMRKTKIRNRQLDAMAAPEVGGEAQSGFLFDDEE